jgi:hypothetical protein
MKKIFLAILTVAALAIASTATAQNIGLYRILSGGTTTVPAGVTNQIVVGGVTNQYGLPGTATNLAQSVQDYNTAGLTISLTGTATSTNSVLIYKSFDNGTTYEANPSFSYTGIAPGAAAWSTNASLTLTDVTTLGFVVKSSGTTDATNVLVELNLKAPRQQVQAAGIYNSGSGPVPSITNTNW